MAYKRHLMTIERGVAAWNYMRFINPTEKIDLRNANLKGAILCKANLKSVDLSGADLSGADLSGADLSGAILSDADLTFTKLSDANLEKVDLTRANMNYSDLSEAKLTKSKLITTDLSMANLNHANLSDSNLYEANLREANFELVNLTHAYLGKTAFSQINLSTAIGLATCNHINNSFVDYITLKLSVNLPVNFLRGCGFSEKFIKGLPSLIETKKYYNDCFLSYSSKDQEFANKLYNNLQNKGLRVWFAPEDMKIAAKIRPALHEAIEQHSKLLIVLSKNSMKSAWVEDEVEKAFEIERTRKETVLFPIRLDDSIFETEAGWANSIKNTRNIGDFTNWKDHNEYKKNFEKLVESLRIEHDITPKQ